jgi:ATP-dependent exoDNAse (exonuclease V) beta subunit
MSAIPDREQRLRALDPSTSFVVQAPAGSGKTELLNQRYLTLLARVEEPESVVAITFTRKAAGEMRRRVLEALRDSAGPQPEQPHATLTWELARAVRERSEARGWDLFRNPARLRIRTIDSLSASLTRQMPWLSRLGGPPDVLDDAEELYAEAARRTIELLETDEWAEQMEVLLTHLDNDFQALQKLLVGMLARRDQWLRHLAGASNPQEARAGLEAALRNVIRDGIEDVRRLVPNGMAGEIVAIVAAASVNLRAEGREGRAIACTGVTTLPGPEDLDLWLGIAETLLKNDGDWRVRLTVANGFPTTAKPLKKRAEELIQRLSPHERFREELHGLRSLPADHFPESQWQALAALVRMLPVAAAQLQIEFRQRGAADYGEVAMAAQRALGDAENPTDLSLTLDYRIQHLLVDEFQDTSVSQYDLLLRLTAGWEPGDGRTIFAVGDPMQSIYRFREAEVGVFLKACREGIGQIPLEPLQLTANFRSDSGIVDWVNETFPEVMPPAENITTGAIPYHRCEPVNAVGLSPAVTFHPFVGRDDEAEAAKVVELVHNARQDGRKVTILVRARTHLNAILPALRAAGLRYRAVEIDSLAAAGIIRDLTALTRAMLHRADRIAWLAVLRAPWCGLTLAGLNTLAGNAPGTIWDLMHDESRIMAIDAPDRQRLQRVRDVLDRTFAKRPASLRGWIEGAWVFLGGPACANAAEDLEDAAAFFDLLEEMDEGGTLDAAGFESQIEKLYANPDALADDAIQVMSIHKAKGLQFDTVIVPGLGRKPRSDDSRLMLWLERPRFQERSDLLLAPIHATGADEDTIYSYLKGIDARKAEYEAGRMLYVAATRAKNELHLLGHTAWKEKDGVMELSLPQSSSLLRRMWTVAEPLFQQVAREVAVPAAAAEAISTREPQRLERLAAGWALPAPPSGPAVGELDAETDDEKPMSFYWVGNTLRHIGTVVHEVLQRIGQDGLAAWTPERVRALAPAFRSALSSLGVPTAELDNAAGRAADAVLGTLRDERGRWILRNDRAATACEYPICGVIDSRVVSVRVDRTFVDSDGTRWIIDYKTSFHEGSGIDAFLDNELARYRGQMTAYTRLFAVMEDRPVRTALYFPLLGSWRELERTFAQG